MFMPDMLLLIARCGHKQSNHDNHPVVNGSQGLHVIMLKDSFWLNLSIKLNAAGLACSADAGVADHGAASGHAEQIAGQDYFTTAQCTQLMNMSLSMCDVYNAREACIEKCMHQHGERQLHLIG